MFTKQYLLQKKNLWHIAMLVQRNETLFLQSFKLPHFAKTPL